MVLELGFWRLRTTSGNAAPSRVVISYKCSLSIYIYIDVYIYI